MPELVLRAADAHARLRIEDRAARRALVRDARYDAGLPQHGEPVEDGRRILAYYRQNGTPRRPLTPRQQRRRKHKDPSLRTL
jgi:hypothetical protein